MRSSLCSFMRTSGIMIFADCFECVDMVHYKSQLENITILKERNWCLFKRIARFTSLPLNVTFLNAEWVDGPVTWVDDAVFGASSHDSLVHCKAGVFGNVQLPSELADKWQAHSSHLEGGGHIHTEEQAVSKNYRTEIEWNRCQHRMEKATENQTPESDCSCM